ncbi:hypothetical protein OT109_18275 [Phycisphaeraceae bacterium D3-23]
MRTLSSLAVSAIASAGLCIAGGAAGQSNSALLVDVQASNLEGYDYEFNIYNLVPTAEVTGIYFEDDWDTYFSSSPFHRNIRVDPGPLTFIEGGFSPNLSPWTTSLVSYEVPTGSAGVETNGVATIAFVDNGSTPLNEQLLFDAINDPGFGIGLRIEYVDTGTIFQFAQPDLLGVGAGGGGSSVPTPGTGLMALALVGVVCRRRRAT